MFKDHPERAQFIDTQVMQIVNLIKSDMTEKLTSQGKTD
jgi:hypothetical protein